MSRKSGLIVLLTVILTVGGIVSVGAAEQFFDLPDLPSPELYGTLLINRVSTKAGMKAVVFSHWVHRQKYTCRVCHAELEFGMQVHSTEITEMGNMKGRFCGSCHNGKIAFKSNGNCARCHSGNPRNAAESFAKMMGAASLPRAEFGNGIDWSDALRSGVIKPRSYLKAKTQDMPFDKELLLEADWSMIPPSVFSHKSHVAWLDCSNCHPDIFNIKKKTTKHFSMMYILRGQFCGYCHLNVAFPMNDCKRCHPAAQKEEQS